MTDLQSTLAQYEADAEKIREKIEELKLRLRTEKGSDSTLRIRRSISTLREEYYELLDSIRRMRRHLEPKTEPWKPGDPLKKQEARYEKICQRCGKPFTTNYKLQAYCSDECRNAGKPKEYKVKICKNCGKEFVASHASQIYCDALCRSRYVSRTYQQRKKDKRNVE